MTPGLGNVVQTPANQAIGAAIAANSPGFTYRFRALTSGFVRPPLTASWTQIANSGAGGFPWGTRPLTAHFWRPIGDRLCH